MRRPSSSRLTRSPRNSAQAPSSARAATRNSSPPGRRRGGFWGGWVGGGPFKWREDVFFFGGGHLQVVFGGSPKITSNTQQTFLSKLPSPKSGCRGAGWFLVSLSKHLETYRTGSCRAPAKQQRPSCLNACQGSRKEVFNNFLDWSSKPRRHASFFQGLGSQNGFNGSSLLASRLTTKTKKRR